MPTYSQYGTPLSIQIKKQLADGTTDETPLASLRNGSEYVIGRMSVYNPSGSLLESFAQGTGIKIIGAIPTGTELKGDILEVTVPSGGACAGTEVYTERVGASDELVTAVAEGADYTIPLNEVQNIDGSNFADFDFQTPIRFVGADPVSSAVVSGRLEITIAAGSTPSGICYQNPQPLFNLSYGTTDSWGRLIAGDYDRTHPSHPIATAQIDYSATQIDVRGTAATGTADGDSVAPTMLKENNAFDNKYRYTDDAGNPSDAAVGSNIWAHVDWNGHSWTGATANYVIDHLDGWGKSQSYLLDGSLFNMHTTNGQSWADWMAYIDGMGTYLGYTGWIPIDGSDIKGAHGAKCMPALTWADNFFNFERSDNRGSFLTGENCSATLYYNLYDSGNNDMMVDVSKSTSTGFADIITNVFVKRKHY